MLMGLSSVLLGHALALDRTLFTPFARQLLITTRPMIHGDPQPLDVDWPHVDRLLHGGVLVGLPAALVVRTDLGGELCDVGARRVGAGVVAATDRAVEVSAEGRDNTRPPAWR